MLVKVGCVVQRDTHEQRALESQTLSMAMDLPVQG